MKGDAVPPVSLVKYSPGFRCLQSTCLRFNNNTACHLATTWAYAPSSALPKYYKWWSRESDRKLALQATTARGPKPGLRNCHNRAPGRSEPRRTPPARF